jgi:anti-sigma-K factor RskA
MKKEEILTSCIEEIRNGKITTEDCIARYPEFGNELRAFLKIAVSLKPDAVAPSPEFKERVKLHLFDSPRPAPVKAARRGWGWLELKPVRVLAIVVAAVVILAAAGGTTVYAAQSSLPGDMLYPVKTSVENIQLAVTTSPAAKARLYLQLAQKRIDEVTRQVKLNRSVTVRSLEIVTQQYDNVLKTLKTSTDVNSIDETLSSLSVISLNQQLELEQAVSGAPQNTQPVVQQIIDEIHRANTIAQVAYANHDLLKQPLSVADQKLDAGQFTIEGTLLSITGRNWDVGGTIIENVHLTGEAPATGSRVKLTGLVKNNNAFISSIEVSDSSSEPTTVEGQFEGTNQNGTSTVSGIPVVINTDSSAPLKAGDKVQLQAGAANNKLNVISQTSGITNIANITGVLSEVDIPNHTITVNMTGSKVKVNISQAQIQFFNDAKNNLKISSLKRFIGHDIRVQGLSKKGNVLSADMVQIKAVK